MNRMFAIVVIALSFLCIAPGALILSATALSKAPAGDVSAQAQFAMDWTRYPPADRASCLRSTGSTGAYTDLLTCLEIKRAARQLPKEPGIPHTLGQGGPSGR
jgi:hypothetical protein